MNNSINIDLVVESVKNIVDHNRCIICDKTNGAFMRYPCGHTSCEECAKVTEDCLHCISPLQCTHKTPFPDEPLTQRVKNAESLLNACQNVFHTDVYRRKRISEQLKVEKELFPECIQAPVKYRNKRKSLNTSIKNKENHPTFSGENILSLKEKNMENSFKYVKQWLNNNEKNLSRKPFADLNTNEQTINRDYKFIKDKTDIKSNVLRNTVKISKQKTNRKRSYFETYQPIAKTQSHILDNYMKSDKKVKTSKDFKKEINKQYIADFNNDMETENDNDESGIVIDEESVVIIDDSQNVDKDKNAWLAVLEADKHPHNDTASIVRLDSGIIEKSIAINKFLDKNEVLMKVPFYKKSRLFETCKYCCNYFEKTKCNSSTTDKSNKVSITVENDSFITIINLTKNNSVSSKTLDKHSISVQTDRNESFHFNNDIEESKSIDNKNVKINVQLLEDNLLNAKHDVSTSSQDLFTEDKKIFGEFEAVDSEESETNLKSSTLNGAKCLIIEESDSDEDIHGGCSLEVTADIHRSCEDSEFGILTEVENQEQHGNRTRRAARGLTPTSTDSSEKENFDPNRIKKTKFGKKTCTKSK